MKFDNLVKHYLQNVLTEEDTNNQSISPRILNDPNFKVLWQAITNHEQALGNKQDPSKSQQTLQGLKDAYAKLPADIKQYGNQVLSTHPDVNVQNMVKQSTGNTQNKQQDSQQDKQSNNTSTVSNNSGNAPSTAPAYKTGTPVG